MRPRAITDLRPTQTKNRQRATSAQGGNTAMNVYRQGDVLIVEATTTPTRLNPVPRENGRLVLAHGEVTGHAHVIEGEAELFTAADIADVEERFLRVERESKLVHDEHSAITIPPGDYRVLRQREYAPEAIRNVAD